jgi:DNA-binding transcriptional ArsR family regulator
MLRVRVGVHLPVTFFNVGRPAHRNAGSGMALLDAQSAFSYIYTIMHIDTFEALADRTRRGIVESLRSGEKPVGEIVKHSGIHQSGVSRHLRILQEAGFVSMRAQGQQRFYALRSEPFRELDAWLAGYRSLWDRRLDRFAGRLKQRKSPPIPPKRART